MSNFDPATGKLIDPEALQSIGVALRDKGDMKPVFDREKGVEHRPVMNELTGEVGGFHTHHSDGSVDATVTIKAPSATGRTKES